MSVLKKRKKQRGCHSHDVSNIEEEIEALFNKKFLLKSSHDTWLLPPASVMFEDPPFVVEDMIEMKNELNRIKSMLNDVDIIQWHLHTRRANKSGLVVKHLREDIRVEMCTQAWAKFYEVLNSFNLIPKEALDAKTFRSLHLCEAPGAFVASLNHFLKSRHLDLDWNWIGTTLNPYYEGHDLKAMLDDDRFILETLPHWNFGADGTGDLMNWANMQALQQDTIKTHLVTADGSIDCADQPAEQENLVSQLMFCEAVAAICLLSEGGNFVFKMFTAFEHQMICLLYLLSCLFDEIQVIKPGTSKSGNSEVYVACLKFVGSDKIPVAVLEKLKSAYTPYFPTRSLFPCHFIHGEFLERLKLCEKYFIGFQMKAIELHIQQFHHLGVAEKKVLFHLRQLVAQRFIEKFDLQPIRKEDHLVSGVYLDGTQLSFSRGPTNEVPFSESFSGRQQLGSYNERQQKLGQHWLDRFTADAMFQFVPTRWISLQGISQANNAVPLIPLVSDNVAWLRRDFAITAEEMQAWKQQTGRSIDCVFNSRFCTPWYISKLRDAKTHAQIMQKENSDMLNKILDKLNLPNVIDKMEGIHAELRNLDNLVQFAEMATGNGVAVLLNLSETLNHLPCYLQERNVRFKCIYHDCVLPESGQPVLTVDENLLVAKSEDTVHSLTPTHHTDAHKVNLVFLDLHIKHARDGQEELQTKRDFLHLCIIALRLLETDGMLVCHIFETLTRFSVGILYILHQLFKEMTVVKPVLSNLHNSRRYLVCKGRHDDGKHLITFLEHVANQLMQVKSAPELTCSDVLQIVPMRVLYSEKFFTFVKRVNEQLAHLQLQTIAQLETFFLFPEKIPSTIELNHLRDEVSKYLNL